MDIQGTICMRLSNSKQRTVGSQRVKVEPPGSCETLDDDGPRLLIVLNQSKALFIEPGIWTIFG